jgi:hypothetical protein
MSDVRSRWLFRVIYMVCAVAMVAYVLFDILDLDGSNLPLTHSSPKGAIFLVTNVSEGETSLLPYLPARPGINSNVLTLPVLLVSLRTNEGMRIAGLALSRRHRYRVALPRSSVPDPFVV